MRKLNPFHFHLRRTGAPVNKLVVAHEASNYTNDRALENSRTGTFSGKTGFAKTIKVPGRLYVCTVVLR